MSSTPDRDALTRAMRTAMTMPDAGGRPWFVPAPTPRSRARRAIRRVLGAGLMVKDTAQQ